MPFDRESSSFVVALRTFARRLLIGMTGGLVLIVGLAMTVLPGPAILVVPLGLAILATEFLWARRLAEKFKHSTDRLIARFRR